MSELSENKAPILAGVVGFPIGHSRSPLLHKYWLKRYGIDGHYIPISLSSADFVAGIRSLPRLGFRGANITLPHKVSMLGLADSVSDRAALIGAVNTVTFKQDGSIRGDNTDGYGFIQNLRQNAPDWDPRSGPALVLGAGGAARAVVSALLSEGVSELRLANRTRQRATLLADQFGAKVQVVDWNRASDAVDGATTIINTTSLGMQGQPALGINLGSAPPNATVSDLVYTPLITPFLEQAATLGLKVVDGLGMLLHQGVPGFELWFGHRPEVDEGLRMAVLDR
ncbi:MAG: shikimate dehydrogenase [Rhodobacteraceae bacterium]|nr:shikimate dehydrogenase [Paracoccaceae bacterium]